MPVFPIRVSGFPASGQLLSILQQLTGALSVDAPLDQRVSLLGATLSLTGIGAPHLTQELLHICKSEPLLQGSGGQEAGGLELQCLAAAVLLLRSAGSGCQEHLPDLATSLFLPVLASRLPAVAAKHAEVAGALAAALFQQPDHHLTVNVLALCATLLPSPAAAAQQDSSHSPTDASGDSSVSKKLPLHAVCHLVHAVLQQASLASQEKAESGAEVQQAALDLLFGPACALLWSEDDVQRQASLRVLLPALLQAALQQPGSTPMHSLQILWDHVRDLLHGNTRQHSTGLRALERFAPLLLPTSGAAGSLHFDIRQHDDFWGLLRSGLASTDSQDRKRALSILQHALGPEAARAASWAAWLSLFQLLEEFALYLIEDPWTSQIGSLQASGAAPDTSAPVLSGAGEGSSVDPECTDFAWMSVLWRRGFGHRSHQVQRLVMQSFLSRHWAPAQLAQIEAGFVVEGLLVNAAAPLVLEGEQAQMQESLADFLASYMTCVDAGRQRAVVDMLLNNLLREALPQVTLQVLVALLAHASTHAGLAAAGTEPAWLADVVSRLRSVTTFLSSYSSQRLHLQVYQGLVDTATALAPPPALCLGIAGALLEVLPLGQLQPGAELRGATQAWLLGSDSVHSSWFLAGARALLDELYAAPASGASANISDIAAWKQAANRWARLMLVGEDAAGPDKEALMRCLGEAAQQLYQRPYLPQGTAERTLLLLHALFQVSAQPARLSAAGGRGWLHQHLLLLSLQICDELAAYARSALQTFWAPWDLPVSSSLPSQAQPYALDHDPLACLPPFLQAAATRASLAARCTAAAWQAVQQPPTGSGACSESQRALAQPGVLGGVGRDRLVDAICRETEEAGRVIQNQAAESGSGSLASLDLLKWRALDAALAGCQAPGSSTVSQATVLRLLRQAVEAADAIHQHSMPSLLACIRFLLRYLLQHPEAIPDAAAAVAASPAEANGHAEPAGPMLAGVLWAVLRPCWTSYCDCDKKHAPLVAAWVDTALLSEVFQCEGPDDPRVALHEERGPVCWVMDQLIDAGKQSARLVSLAALQLCACLLRCPPVARYYTRHLQRLLMFAIDRGIMDGFEAAAASSLAAHEISQLSCLDPQLAAAVQATTMAPRITAVCCIYQLARIANDEGPATAYRQAAGAVGRQLWADLLELATGDPELRRGKYQAGSLLHRRKARLWQALCILARFVQQEAVPPALNTVWDMLQVGDVSSVRQYQEAIMVRLLLQCPDQALGLLLPVLQRYTRRYEGLPSMIMIAAQLLLHAAPAVRPAMLAPLFSAVLPWALDHHHATRAFAQLVLQLLMERFPEELALTASAPLQAMRQFMDANADLLRLRSSLGPDMRSYDPELATSPAGVFVQRLQNGAGEAVDLDGTTVEGASATLLERITDFLLAERAALRKDAAQAVAGMYSPRDNNTGNLAQASAAKADYQRKITPDISNAKLQASHQDRLEAAVTGLEVDMDALDLRDALAEAEGRKSSGVRQQLIVVGSLLGKAPNLAGLTRTAEAFRAAALVVADLKILKEHAYTSISVTAEQWIPIHQVPLPGLVSWLEGQRRAGYTLVGLEQTAGSRSLPDYDFPERTVLVLGREREGIPPDILACLDGTAEIPQLGFVRSLNVHVSGAIAMYEYTRQRLRTLTSDGAQTTST
ncbi:hypothetical protein WJX72_011367 [[Myrmecia] bisecta]|uniref:tRNA/rRNA methyltransferase SpoU type domain-containing protein n=1 Tax=[Myrmecia] bisecta TaxID=41462 RepID=A0AAW1P0V6_9CHLO